MPWKLRPVHAVFLLLTGLEAGASGGCGAAPVASTPVTVDTSLALQPVVSGLSFPLYLTAPVGDTGRLFVVEKGGRIRIVKQGTLLPAAFLDLRGVISTGGEQGLLGLAFHPQYASNGRFFVDFTNPAGDTRVVAYQVSANPDSADPTSGDTILKVAQPYSNHNGGGVTFGPDGYLYIGLGDGGSGGDPDGHGQDRTELLGSLLRIDVDGESPYTSPADNPYFNSPGLAPELWNYGLRNPWRFSFDRLTGDLYIGDVGQNDWEEVDVTPPGSAAGANYGWNLMEGLSCYRPVNCNPSGLTLPVLQYDHNNGCAVTGGYVYRGPAMPGLHGTYFYADYCNGWVRSFRYQAGQAMDPRDWPTLAPGASIPSFGEDARGELYLLTTAGTVYRIVAN